MNTRRKTNEVLGNMACEMRGGVVGGLTVRKMNEERGMGDTSGQTLMDSVPVGSDSNIGYQVLT